MLLRYATLWLSLINGYSSYQRSYLTKEIWLRLLKTPSGHETLSFKCLHKMWMQLLDLFIFWMLRWLKRAFLLISIFPIISSSCSFISGHHFYRFLSWIKTIWHKPPNNPRDFQFILYLMRLRSVLFSVHKPFFDLLSFKVLDKSIFCLLLRRNLLYHQFLRYLRIIFSVP